MFIIHAFVCYKQLHFLSNPAIQVKKILQKSFIWGGNTETVYLYTQPCAAHILLDCYLWFLIFVSQNQPKQSHPKKTSYTSEILPFHGFSTLYSCLCNILLGFHGFCKELVLCSHETLIFWFPWPFPLIGKWSVCLYTSCSLNS